MLLSSLLYAGPGKNSRFEAMRERLLRELAVATARSRRPRRLTGGR
jgi:hypothetical protein